MRSLNDKTLFVIWDQPQYSDFEVFESAMDANIGKKFTFIVLQTSEHQLFMPFTHIKIIIVQVQN
jgi:hypothetical protein